MAAQTLETHAHHNSNGSAVSGSSQGADGHAPAVADLPLINGHGQSEDLLETDLEKYRGNADALLGISVNLQKLGTEQKAEIQRLKAENIIIAPSKGDSRRQTDETHSSRATTMSVDHDQTVVVYSASDNELTVRQRRSMKDEDYIQAELPPFHWWSDRLHIYFERRPSSDSSVHDNPQVVVVKDEIPESSIRDVKLIRTVRLTQLGIRIRVRRMLGQIKFIYVLSPRPQSTHIKDMASLNGRNGAQPLTKIKSAS
ncbi:uncharacterized protein K444DRAFT_336057 [Hyaloscypha bicolor E]|jgi:hypothetical protein|uniref:Uncharacterized protein n=1 Tax=Hyaloscypha bicolor E TaxID=1095630 RepID=A0A2J6TK68_9HELO|nr:uncharacterized protein K444DRAFT_336057 [Hyaloscypha bicolor E]PMD63411.1 hypothetical protein K444DRAFT_336057 [Hyaloscypha bicolor E]